MQFTGNPSNYTHVKAWSTTYYTTTPAANKKYSWINNAACTTAYPAVCEIPKSFLNCPTSPPPAPPPSPYSFGLCELDWLVRTILHTMASVAIFKPHATHKPLSHTPAGLPAQDAYNWCPTNDSTCYFYNRTTAPFATHKQACSKMGGYLVSYNR